MTRAMSPEPFVASILQLLERSGGDHYGEAVTQLDHALQTAHHARDANEPDSLVAAALLHDIGHLLQKQGQDAADRGVDALHERIGAAWLAQGFGPDVTEPVRLHVEAKRYLATREPGYADALSPASRQSLALQGGAMSAVEAEAFEVHPPFRAGRPAAALRRTGQGRGHHPRAPGFLSRSSAGTGRAPLISHAGPPRPRGRGSDRRRCR
ncbi:HD domain-containing protein [Brevundimonas sp. R86498]|uniref:HD domain-containing protein n=1 Tax=Brevundimonas sp. R86498 TaxID=3093845 RepID=UPI0037C6657C